MVTLTYTFEENQFDYEVSRMDIESKLYEYLNDEWTKEDLIEYIIDNDGTTSNLLKDFEEIIYDLFESEAEEHYYDCKTSDNGVDQEDFV
jgi:dephospho-CoA kinase